MRDHNPRIIPTGMTATALATLSLLSTPSLATTDNLPEVTVSANRLEQPINKTGSSMAILSADELQERGISFVADALAEVPSLVVNSQGPRGSMTQIRVRGNEANHILVLFDGVRVSNASTGEYDFANLSLNGIEKIELLLGPQSTLYGSDAIAGVINIISKKGAEGFDGSVTLGTGSQSTRSGAVQLSGGRSGFTYHLNADRYYTEGISAASASNGNSETDGYDKSGVNLQLGYQATPFKTWLSYNRNDSRYDFDSDDFMTGMAVDAPDNRQWGMTDAFVLGVDIPLFDHRMQNRLQVSKSNNDLEVYSVFFGSGSTYITETDRNGIEYQGSYKLNDNNTLQFGAEGFRERLLAAGYTTFKESALQKGAYLQWLATIGAWDLSAGTRWDNHQAYGIQNTYRLTGNYRIDQNWRLHASHSTGFKAPSLQELYDTSFGGNPDLKPEESTSSEIGIEYSREGFHGSLTLFKQTTDNLIRYVGFYPIGVNQNVDEGKSKGAELTFGYTAENWNFEASFARTNATETMNGVEKRRLRVPDWSGNLLVNYYLPVGRIWGEARFRGDRRDSNFATGKDLILDSYWLFNLGSSYDLNDQMTLTARIENLTDRHYEEIYSYGTRGRTGMLSVDWRF